MILPFFIKKFSEGLAAMKFNELTGEKVPDYKQSLIPHKFGIRTRLEYHRILGKLLGF